MKRFSDWTRLLPRKEGTTNQERVAYLVEFLIHRRGSKIAIDKAEKELRICNGQPHLPPRIAADYTTRSNYQENYRKSNRDAINARKRAWRAMKAIPETDSPTPSTTTDQLHAGAAGRPT